MCCWAVSSDSYQDAGSRGPESDYRCCQSNHRAVSLKSSFYYRIIMRRRNASFLQLEKNWTCSRVLIPFWILRPETSETDKKLIIFNLSGAYSKNWAVKTNYKLYEYLYTYHSKNSSFLLFSNLTYFSSWEIWHISLHELVFHSRPVLVCEQHWLNRFVVSLRNKPLNCYHGGYIFYVKVDIRTNKLLNFISATPLM